MEIFLKVYGQMGIDDTIELIEGIEKEVVIVLTIRPKL